MTFSARHLWTSVRTLAVASAATAWLLCASPNAWAAASPAELLAGYSESAGRSPDPAQGRHFFLNPHGREWACASCHTSQPTGAGQHAATGKVLSPMAPAFNPERFTSLPKAEKWFRRNCMEVLGRECSAAEKADVLAWLMSLK